MSEAISSTKLGAARQTLLAAVVLMLALVITWLPGRLAVAGSQAETQAVATLGFLLLAGSLCAELISPLKLPHLTGYLLAGVVVGPHVLGLVDESSVVTLQKVNGLALALIAFAAGAELSLDMLKGGIGRLSAAVAAQVAVLPVILGLTFFLSSRFMPFLAGQPLGMVLGLSLMWGVVSAVKSPAAVLGVLAETRADGPLTKYAVAMVVVLDVAVLVLFQLAAMVSRALIEPGSSLSFAELGHIGHELLSSVSLGTMLGLVVAVYLAWVDRGVILFLLGLAFFIAQLDSYFGYDLMLVFATAGFLVQNMTRQGKKLLKAVHRSGSIIFVVFFAVAGADLDLHTLRLLWPIALLLAGVRAVATIGAAATASRLTADPPAVRRWGWTSLISQAGVALGIALAVEKAVPASGAGFRSLAVAVVGLNEAVGPVLFKFALARTGELGRVAEE